MAVCQLDTEAHPPENGFVTPETSRTPDILSQIDGGVFARLGGFGRFQIQLVVLTCIPAIFIGFSQFSDYFLLGQPYNTCARVHENNSDPSAAAPAFSGVSNGSNGTDRSSQCFCKQSEYKLETGLERNVVTKVRCVITRIVAPSTVVQGKPALFV